MLKMWRFVVQVGSVPQRSMNLIGVCQMLHTAQQESDKKSRSRSSNGCQRMTCTAERGRAASRLVVQKRGLEAAKVKRGTPTARTAS
jgi:hypothetical protein